LEALLAGRFAEAVAVVPALRDKPHLPELRLLLAIAQYNNRRIPEVLPNLGGLLDEIPGPIVAAISALAHLPTGAANEALSILDRASRLPESDRDILHHLRGLALLELGRHSEAEKSFSRVSNEKVRRYSLGLLEMDRGNGAKAAEHFRACGKYYPAQYHLACVTASDGPGAIALIDTTIKAAWSAGEFNRTGRNEPLQPRTRVAFRGIPYFILGRETLLHDKLLQPLRDDPETGARLRGLAGQ